jgi:hypothetical protein
MFGLPVKITSILNTTYALSPKSKTMRNIVDVTEGKIAVHRRMIAVYLRSASCNPLVAFYDIHPEKERGAILLFWTPHETYL